MEIIFTTYCQKHLQKRFGTYKLINSFRYFHPDIKIYLYEDDEINRVYREYNVNLSNALPALMLDAKRKFNSNYICHIDSDSLCLGRLDNILKLDYQIASCMNNPDIGDRDERQNRPRELWNLPNNKYVSCGCLSTNSEDFLLKWIYLNDQIAKIFGGIKAFWMCDQNWMNVLFHYGGYQSKILDPLDGNVFYGASANMYSPNNHNPDHIIKEYGVSTWQSWYDIEYKDNGFWMYDKSVRLIHQSGGGNANTVNKISYDMFNEKTANKIKEITRIYE